MIDHFWLVNIQRARSPAILLNDNSLFLLVVCYAKWLWRVLTDRTHDSIVQNQIGLVRRFNRAVTQRIGALDDAYLSRGRSLGLSRLLWEIAGWL